MDSEALDKVSRAYHRLKGIRDTLPQTPHVQEGWVQEYHKILDSIRKVLDLEEFRIPEEHLRRLDQNPNGAEILAQYRDVDYVPDLTEDRYIGRRTFCMRLDALLSYLKDQRERPDENST